MAEIDQDKNLDQKKATQKRASAQQPSANKQSQGITEKQSKALVQIMLHASFGTLFYLREYLPLSCFGERDLVKLSRANAHVSYDGFISGRTTKYPEGTAETGDDANLGKRGQPLKVILRNRNDNADRVLDILERGIFEALEKNYLEAVQLTVFVDKSAPSKVLESYTFSFKYTGQNGVDSNSLASVSFQPEGLTANMQTVRSAKAGLESIIRRLITLSTFLPALPHQRFMEFHLFYTDDCPPDYEPPCFQTSPHGDLVFPHSISWSRETQTCGTMDTGHHCVGLKVTSLKWSGADPEDPDNTGEIPDGISYSDTVPRADFVGIDSHDLMLPDIAPASQGSSQLSTQTRQDAATKKVLQKMAASSTPDSSLIPTQLQPHSLEDYNFEDSDDPDSNAPELSQAKFQLMFESQMHQEDSQGKEEVNDVKCQCGSKSAEPEAIQCAICHTWQHVICYGFFSAKDPRIPETHACYACLLEPDEAPLLKELSTLILVRRALKIIIEEGYPHKIRDFTQKLNCNGQLIAMVTDLLRKENLLQATKGSKSKGFQNTGLPKFTVPQTLEAKHKIRKLIFNPLAKISHHYVMPGESVLPRNQTMSKTRERETVHLDEDPSSDSLDYQQPVKRTLEEHWGEKRSQMTVDTVPGAESVSQSQDVLKATGSNTHKRQRSQSVRFAGEDEEEDEQGVGSEKENRPLKRRKLSNAGEPIDVCEPQSDETGSSEL